MENVDLVSKLRSIFPKDSIGRYDLLPVFLDADLFTEIIKYLAEPYVGKIDYVASPEALGWVLGSAIARELNIGFIPLRKSGKLPYPKNLLISHNYADYSNVQKSLEIKRNYITTGYRILIVDEWVETGKTMQCCIDILKELGCVVVGLATIGIDSCEGTKNWIDSNFIRYIGRDI